MGKQKTKALQQQVSRRGMIAAVSAAVVGSIAAPSVANADATTVPATKKEAAYFSFEVARYKHDSNSYERVSNKTNTVDENSTYDQYPSAQAVYNFIKRYENYTQTVADKGKALFVGDGKTEGAGAVGGTKGHTTLGTYTVDPYDESKSTEMDDYSGLKGGNENVNPVENRIVYRELVVKIGSAFELDDIPTQHDDSAIKNIPKSGGVYETYQVVHSTPKNLAECIAGVTYNYYGRDIAQDATDSSKSLNWSVKRFDDTFIAVNRNEIGALMLANSSLAFKRPQCMWHS